MSIKVMVVDDSRFIFEELKFLLKESEYEVSAYCRDGEDAVAVYEKSMPDLVTMDIILPGMDGLETMQLILERWPDARVVVMSSLAYSETIDQAKTLGSRGFVFKPFDRKQILKNFAEALK